MDILVTDGRQPPSSVANKPYVSGSYVDELAEEEMFAASNQQQHPHQLHNFDLVAGEDGRRYYNSSLISRGHGRGGLVTGGLAEDDDEDDGLSVSVSADRSKQKLSSAALSRPSMQAIVTWLKSNYEEYPGCNTSRENLFSEYSQFAQSQGIMIMNSASFGKLIRAVFPGIQTRRLGVRGQSKYHYNGIRPKPATGNKDYLVDMPPSGGQNNFSAEELPSSPSTYHGGMSNPIVGEPLSSASVTNTSNKRPRSEKSASTKKSNSSAKGASTVDIQLPGFPAVPEQLFLENNVPSDQIQMFIGSLHQHYSEMIGLINKMNSEKMEILLLDFWRVDSLPAAMDLLNSPFMAKYICDCDIYVYSAILNAAHNESFSSENPGLTQYEMLATFFDGWVNESLASVPDIIKVTKVQVAKCFSTALRRAVSLLNNATQTRALLNSDYLLQQMVADWGRLDSENINEFVSWACQWQEDFLFAVENDIVSLLHRRASITNWTTWLNSLIQRSVNFPMLHEAYDLNLAEHNSRQFVSKFAFFTSQILRDIAIRTVSSFGSYHTLRLFLDEYIWYMVTKNLSILKINHLAKMGIHHYPAWTNGILFYYLEQRHFFGSINAAPNVITQSHPTELTADQTGSGGDSSGTTSNNSLRQAVPAMMMMMMPEQQQQQHQQQHQQNHHHHHIINYHQQHGAVPIPYPHHLHSMQSVAMPPGNNDASQSTSSMMSMMMLNRSASMESISNGSVGENQ